MNRFAKRVSQLKQQYDMKAPLPPVTVNAADENALAIIEGAQRNGHDVVIDVTAIKNRRLFLCYDIIVYNGWACVQRFMNLSACGTDEEYMLAYKQAVKEFCGIPEVDHDPVIFSHAFRENGHWLSDEELKETAIAQSRKHRETVIDVWKGVLKKSGDSSLLVVADLLEQMDILSVADLVERYKNPKWKV